MIWFQYESKAKQRIYQLTQAGILANWSLFIIVHAIFRVLLVINMFNNSLILIVLFWFNFGSCKHQYRFSVSELLSCNQGKPSDPIPSSLLSPLHSHNQQRQHTPSQYPPTSCRSLLPFPHSSPFPSLSPFTPPMSVPIQITFLTLTPFPSHFNPTPYSHPTLNLSTPASSVPAGLCLHRSHPIEYLRSSDIIFSDVMNPHLSGILFSLSQKTAWDAYEKRNIKIMVTSQTAVDNMLYIVYTKFYSKHTYMCVWVFFLYRFTYPPCW